MKLKISEKDIEKFNKSEIGKIKNSYLKRSTIIGIILTIFGLCYLVLNIYNNVETFDYILSITILLFGLYFIINSKIIKKKEIIKFLNDKKSSKK